MNRTDELIDRYLHRMPGASEAYRNDATYHAQFHFMRRVLTAVDMAMEDEGVPEATRVRVLRSAIYGAPDEWDAEQRIQQVSSEAVRLAMQGLSGRE
jgi:hypothetical protein